MPKVCNLHMPPREIFRKENNQREFRKLNGLKRKRTEIKPALRALHDCASNNHRHEKQNGREVCAERETRSAQKTPVNERRYEKYRECEREPNDLPFKKTLLAAAKRENTQNTTRRGGGGGG